MMINQMEKYEIKFVVELMIYFSVPVASVCLLVFPLQKAAHFVQLPYPRLLTLCQTNMHVARIFQQS